MTLSLNDFGAYFHAVHGDTPFRWQRRLMEEVAGRGWPEALDVPTAAGKTAVIDIAVFHLALEAVLPPAVRRAPLRMFLVVDRRVVVDAAFIRARRIARALAAARGQDSVLGRVADRLAALSQDRPLQTVILRGGLYHDERWTRSPCQPTVCVSTVDQIGSRLLFRGYGISDGMAPVHAGLIGTDSLIVVDEAHLSRPAVQTFAMIGRYRAAEAAIGRPVLVLEMTATPAGKAARVFRFDPVQDGGDAALERRLAAAKLAALDMVDVRNQAPASAIALAAARFVEHALALAAGTLPPALTGRPGRRRRGGGGDVLPSGAVIAPPKVIGIVVNQVALARQIADRLQRHLPPGGEVVLLTGRSRPLDRDHLLNGVSGAGGGYLARIGAGRDRSRETGGPLFVVATQCIEAGADLDFDALVTQLAPLDALRQRFGRLDRLGLRQTTAAVIVAVQRDLRGRSTGGIEDPVYGAIVEKVWAWLGRQAGKGGVVNFGVNALAVPTDPAERESLNTLPVDAPVLLPAHIDRLAMTSPRPTIAPDPALLLHGPEAGPAEVQVVWRADLPDFRDAKAATALAIQAVAACPPAPPEAMPLPVWAVRDWLARLAGETHDAPPAAVADVEGVDEEGAHRGGSAGRALALRWNGPDDSALVAGPQVRPGDTVVVPAVYGGCDRWGWAPDSRDPVTDLAEEAAALSRRRVVLRLHPRIVAGWPREPDEPDPWPALRDLLGDGGDADAGLLLAWLGSGQAPSVIRDHAAKLGTSPLLVPYDDTMQAAGVILIGPRRLPLEASEAHGESGDDADAEDDAPSFTRRIKLVPHLGRVRDTARDIAGRLGLGEDLVTDLGLAGWWHDAGKAEARTQAMLGGGVVPPVPLAKGGPAPARDRRKLLLIREDSGLPRGVRHECWSVRLAEASRALDAAEDRALVVWLIGTHHGYGRPWLPEPPDDGPEDARVVLALDGESLSVPVRHGLGGPEAGWADRFRTLARRYGHWSLAYLEAVLRLADHEVSRREAKRWAR